MGDIKKKIGHFNFVDTVAGQYAINMNWSQEMSQFFNGDSKNWDGDPTNVAGVRVVPWGPDNNMLMLSGIYWRKIIWDPVSWTGKWDCCMDKARCFTG